MIPLLSLLLLGGCNEKSNEEGATTKQGTSNTTNAQDSGVVDGDTANTDDETDAADEEVPADEYCDGDAVGSGELVGEALCTDGVCTIAAGQFVMGSVSDRNDECPSHRVYIDAFRMDQHEVTWSQHDACVAAGECESPPAHCRTLAESWVEDGSSVSNLPVVCLDFRAARNYCAYAGGRLPTEAEWEKAARGTDGARWPWGNEAPNCDLANYRFVSWYCKEGAVAVGGYPGQTAYGIKDMAGNVWEWTADHFDAEAYRTAERDNPSGPTTDCHENVGGEPMPCFDRVIRGGAYNVTAANIRASARSRAEPGWYDTNLGVRCAY